MKELTGGDQITARGLFKNPVDFKPQFTLFLMCNQLPPVPGDDEGTWRRMEVVKFISTFIHKKLVKEGDDKNNIYEMDTKLSEKLNDWKLPFMIKLLHIFKHEYLVKGITVPKAVTEETDNYRSENDLITDFINDTYIISEIKESTTSIKKISDKFTEWCSENQISSKDKPNKKEFEAKLIKMQKATKYGYKNKTKFNFVEKECILSSDSDED